MIFGVSFKYLWKPSFECRARCRWSCWLLAALALQLTARADQIIYDDALENGWVNWGWATLNYANTSPVHSGSDSISVTIVSAGMAIHSGIPHGFQPLHEHHFLDERRFQRRTAIAGLWLVDLNGTNKGPKAHVTRSAR